LEVPVEFIGDIERAFGSVIYPNRVLIAIVSADRADRLVSGGGRVPLRTGNGQAHRNAGSFTVRLEDFAVRNGPDLFVYLSPDAAGYVEGAVELGRLKADQGNQNYQVPAGTDVSRGASVVIWCKQFAVVFAIAALT
jgi:hypothetical protein